MPSTFVRMKSFVKRFFLKHHSVFQWIFLVQSDSNFSTEKRDTRYYEKKIFDSPIFLKHWKDAHEVFRHCETWNFRRKTWYPQICIKFFATPNFLKHSREAREFFWHCEAQIFRRKTCSFHPQNFSKPETFSKTVGLPYENFRHWETYKFRLKNVICPLLSINFFRYQKVSGKQKGSFTKNFVSVLWDKKNRQNRDAPPFLCTKIFDKRSFQKHQIVVQWNFLVQSDKNFQTEKRDTIYHEINFSIPQIFWNIEGMPTKFFGTVRPKIFGGKTWYPPFYPQRTFRNQKFSQKQWDSVTKLFGSVRHKNFDWKSWYVASYP